MLGLNVYRATNTNAQVDGRPNEGEHEVEAYTGIYLPASLDLVHPEQQQPGHDDEHSHPHQELDAKVKELDVIAVSLRTRTKMKAVPSCHRMVLE